MDFKDHWDLESAMKVLAHDTVDGKVWAEAVKWLILHGPVEIRQLLLEASALATSTWFPELKPTSFTSDGQPCYAIGDLAKSLGVTEKEVNDLLRQNDGKAYVFGVAGNNGNETIH